jgi:hypothetical protein
MMSNAPALMAEFANMQSLWFFGLVWTAIITAHSQGA